MTLQENMKGTRKVYQLYFFLGMILLSMVGIPTFAIIWRPAQQLGNIITMGFVGLFG